MDIQNELDASNDEHVVSSRNDMDNQNSISGF